MNAQTRPLDEVTERAITVLAREIGVADTIRFIGQFSSGHGDYTAEREALIGNPGLDEIFKEIDRIRKEKGA